MTSTTVRFCTLASGSSGNVIYCDNSDGAILVDAGVSCAQVTKRMASAGLDISRIDGLIITHDHDDHVRAAGAICRKYHFPLFMTYETAKSCKKKIGTVNGIRCFQPGDTICAGGFQIMTLPTPHDARCQESVALILQRHTTRVGLFTDMGHCFEGLGELLSEVDAILLESNYDPEMLSTNPNYPEKLKKRISGLRGHLSNLEAAELVRDYATKRLKAILLSHLSDKNNLPELALKCHQQIAAEFLSTNKPILDIAPRHVPSKLFVIDS